MSLEERTLVVRGIDENRVTHVLLNELLNNFGPVVKIILRTNHAFVEYKDRDSVAYALYVFCYNFIFKKYCYRTLLIVYI